MLHYYLPRALLWDYIYAYVYIHIYINHHISLINYHYYLYSRKDKLCWQFFFKCLTKHIYYCKWKFKPESSSSPLLPSIIDLYQTDSSAKKLLKLSKIKTNKQTAVWRNLGSQDLRGRNPEERKMQLKKPSIHHWFFSTSDICKSQDRIKRPNKKHHRFCGQLTQMGWEK